MVGGLDRYYQIARCLRDEDLRADRQFEFMQLDAEMSFADADDVMARHRRSRARRRRGRHRRRRPGPVSQMTWHQAQERYGSDKPDVRFGLELVDLSEVYAATEFRAFQADLVKGDPAARARATMSRAPGRQAGRPGQAARRRRARVDAGRATAAALDCPVLKFLSEAEQLGIVDAHGRRARRPRCWSPPGARRLVDHVLGTLRVELGRPPVHEGGLQFLWVVDFPLFEALDDDGNPIPAHHPFTMPHPDDLELLAHGTGEDLLAVRSQAYDLVLNGWELGSGTVRIHRPDLQQRIFSLLGITTEEAQSRFGFLLDAFRYGAPPHAGFAFGIDRLTAILAGEDNIREVIAFPKTQSGRRSPHRCAHRDRRRPSSRSSASASSPNPRSRQKRLPSIEHASPRANYSSLPTHVRGFRSRSAPPKSVAQGGGGYGRAGRSGGFGLADPTFSSD